MSAYTQQAINEFIGLRVRLKFSIGGFVGHWSGPYWIAATGATGFYYQAQPIESPDGQPKHMRYEKLQGIEVMK